MTYNSRVRSVLRQWNDSPEPVRSVRQQLLHQRILTAGDITIESQTMKWGNNDGDPDNEITQRFGRCTIFAAFELRTASDESNFTCISTKTCPQIWQVKSFGLPSFEPSYVCWRTFKLFATISTDQLYVAPTRTEAVGDRYRHAARIRQPVGSGRQRPYCKTIAYLSNISLATSIIVCVWCGCLMA